MSPPSSPLRLALFGAGLIGARHLQIASEEPACEIVAVADPAPAARQIATRHGARFYSDHGVLLEQESLDGVIIATPNALHAQGGIDCARHGLAMLVEKPITDSIESARALVEAAERAGVAVAVGHHRRFDAAVEAARRVLEDGRVGRLAAVECMWSLRKHDTYYDAQWRRVAPGGGPVLINLIHDIDLLRHLCGEIVRVHAELGSNLRGNEVEDVAAVTLRFASGALGTIIASDAAPSPWGWEQGTGDNPDIPASERNCYRFLGTHGALAFPRLELWTHTGTRPGSWHEPLACERIETGPRAALRAQLAHFCRVVRGEEPPRVSGRDGLATLVATLAIRESATSGAPVAL